MTSDQAPRGVIEDEGLGGVTEEEGPRSLVSVVLARWWLVLLCGLVGAVTASVLSNTEPQKYEATSELLFRNDTAPDLSLQSVFGLGSSVNAPDPTTASATDVALASLGTVANMTARAVGPPLTGGVVQSEVSVQEVGQSDVVSITATDPGPAQAAALANTFARQFIVFRQNIDRAVIESAIEDVEHQVAGLSPSQQATPAGQALMNRLNKLNALVQLQTGNAELVQSASLPSAPALPRTKLNVFGGGFLGVILGIALALPLYRMDRRIKSSDDLSGVYGLPLLGVVPETRELRSRRPDRPRSGTGPAPSKRPAGLPAETAESFRALRARLRYLHRDRELHSVVVTSADRGEGRSTVAWQLARVASMTRHRRVLVVEADLRCPGLSHTHGLRPAPGLSEILAGSRALEAVVQQVDVITGECRPGAVGDANVLIDWTDADRTFGLHRLIRVPRGGVDARGPAAGSRTSAPPRNPTMSVVVAGATAGNPSDLFEGERLTTLLGELRDRYDFIVFDAPPAPMVAEMFPIASQADGVIVVSTLRQSSKDAARVLRRQLEELGTPVLGVVANKARRPADAYHATLERPGPRGQDANATAGGESARVPSQHRGRPWVGSR